MPRLLLLMLLFGLCLVKADELKVNDSPDWEQVSEEAQKNMGFPASVKILNVSKHLETGGVAVLTEFSRDNKLADVEVDKLGLYSGFARKFKETSGGREPGKKVDTMFGNLPAIYSSSLAEHHAPGMKTLTIMAVAKDKFYSLVLSMEREGPPLTIQDPVIQSYLSRIDFSRAEVPVARKSNAEKMGEIFGMVFGGFACIGCVVGLIVFLIVKGNSKAKAASTHIG